MGKAEKWKIDMEDAVVSRAMVTYNGKINWPPAPLPVSPAKPKAPEVTVTDHKVAAERKNKKEARSMVIKLAVIGALLLAMGQFAPAEFMQHFTVFVLAVFIGWQVIWNVSHSLHTPLMAVTNAISGIIIVGGLLQTKDDLSSSTLMTVLASVAILVASINIVGGFVVTHRMLKMFKK
jgi:NAD(P) transhydrogenase subunit alpha